MAKYGKIISLIVLLVLLIVLSAGCGLIAACKEVDEYSVAAFDKPDWVPEGQLEIDWKVKRSGNPSAIVFNDVRAAFTKDELTFPEELRSVQYNTNTGGTPQEILAAKKSAIKDELWEYWLDNGYNIGIFRTESFSVGTPSEYYRKILGTYTSSDKSQNENLLSVSLLRAFAYEYAEEFKTESAKFDSPVNDSDMTAPDFRFVGSGVGAVFALYAADYVYGAYYNKNIGEYVLPSRLALIDPWFDDATVLADAADVAERLARFGVAIEYIESDSEAAAGFTDAQIKDRNRIISKSAYLEMRESFSEGLTAETKERIGITWYLASINGSDFFRLSQNPSTERNRKPIYNVPDLYYNTYNNYAVGAWTPTPYIGLLRGIKFTPKTYNYDKNAATDYTADSFRIELYQYSDKEGLRVGGYAFVDKNGDTVMNDGRANGFLKGVTVELVYKSSSSSESSDETVIATAKTDDRGFYLLETNREIYNVRNRTIYVRFKRPNYKYNFNKISGSFTEDVQMWYSVAAGDFTTVGSYYSDVNRMNRTNRLLNCGFTPASTEGR